MSELKACPFCGSTDLRAFMERSRDGQPSHGIQCNGPDCAITGPERDTPEAATAAWNRRAPLPTEPRVSVGPVTALGTATPEQPNVTGRALPVVTRGEIYTEICDAGGDWCDFDRGAAADAILALLREKGVVG